MLLAHAVTLARARSSIAALADRATNLDASIAYERALLQLDSFHDDDIPGISPIPAHESAALFINATAAVENLARHGTDALQVELVLDMLTVAHQQDAS